jgi:hypothetical protein
MSAVVRDIHAFPGTGAAAKANVAMAARRMVDDEEEKANADDDAANMILWTTKDIRY